MSDIPAHPIPGVGAVVMRNDELLLIRRGRGASAGLWAVPGGKVEFGESMRDAVVREVREETGLEVEVGGIVWVGDAFGPGDPPAWHYTLVDFAATVKGGILLAADDAQEVDWVPVGEVLDRPVTPTMIDLVAQLLLANDGRPTEGSQP